jgi:hypothetical protein
MTANNVRRKKTEKNFKQKLRGRTFLWVAIIYNTDLYSTYVYLFFYLSMKKESLICILHIGQGDFALPTPLVVRPLKKKHVFPYICDEFFLFLIFPTTRRFDYFKDFKQIGFDSFINLFLFNNQW